MFSLYMQSNIQNIKNNCNMSNMSEFLAQGVCVPVGQRSGGQLAMMLVATINSIIFFLFSPFPPSSTFQIDGVLRSKKPI